VLTPEGRVPAVPATVLARRGRHTLWQVATSGYLEVVDGTEAVKADRSDISALMHPYIGTPAVAQLRHPLVDYDGRGTPAPSISALAPYTGPPGSVEYTNVSLDDGRFTAQVSASRPAFVMLKESYHPRWGATIDGRPVKVTMLAPSFVGVPVPAGSHLVVFTYHPISYYPQLFAVGFLALLALTITPRLWTRRRRGRPVSRVPATAEPERPSEPKPTEHVPTERVRRRRGRAPLFEEQ
jgi:hypothetical protein